MSLRFSSSIWVIAVLGLVMVTMTGKLVRSDITQDRNECADQLLGLASCLNYASGKAKAPTTDCCTGMKQVVQKSKKCLCILVKDKDDPSLGLQINGTLALGLPALCQAPTDISECISLLNLAPNSPEAKIFKDFAQATGNGTVAPTTPKGGDDKGKSTATATSSISPNTAGRRKRWLVADVATVIFVFTFSVLL